MPKTLVIKKEYVEHTSKTFRLPVEIVDTLDKIAKDKNCSMNKVVIQCLEYAINNIEE